MGRSRRGSTAFAVLVALAATSLIFTALSVPARAEDADDAQPQNHASPNAARKIVGDDDAGGPSILDGIPAFAPLAKGRDRLADTGVHLSGLYLGDPYGNLSGGMKRGMEFAGRLDIQLTVEAEKVIGLPATTLHANMFQIHGRDLSREFIGNFLSSNDIAGLPTSRLYELWVEHQFGDTVSVRAGQIGIDVEFLTSSYAASFVNATFGWPGLPTINLPEGGPAYPLATPAIRVRFDPTPNLSLLAAVFNSDPAGPGPGDPQARDRYGLSFRTGDPPLVFLEGQYRYNQDPKAPGLPGTLKLGAFGDFGHFDDQRLGTDGLSLASAASNGMPVQRTPDIGFYGIIDQQIYRRPGGEPHDGVGVFARAIGSPGSQNPINLYLDAGIDLSGFVPGRPADHFGAAVTYAAIAPAARAFDRDRNLATGLGAPVRDFEAVVELTYIAQVVPGFILQPDLQYIVHPGGNVANPLGNGLAPIRNALVFGVTTQVRF